MTYLNQFHKEKTERCLQKMQSWYTSPMSSVEQQAAAQRMKDNLRKAMSM